MDPYNNFHDFVKMIKMRYVDELKQDMFEMMAYPAVTTTGSVLYYSLEPTPCTQQAPCQKKEKDMNYASAATINVADNTERDQRRHLESRLYEIYSKKKAALKKQFGLIDDEAPESFEDLLARIKDGKYVIADDKKAKKSYGGGLRYVQWRDPSVKEDEAGYEAAKKELYAKYQTVNDTIRIAAPIDGLQALRDFEAADIKAS